jgi:hypothetical protein
MIAAESYGPHTAPTIYDVLAARARSHSVRFLALQGGLAAATAGALLVITPSWWPLAALLLAVASYSAWGLLDARERMSGSPRWLRSLKALLVGVATLGVVSAATGLALAAFTGDRPGPYGACSDSPGHTYACDAHGERADPRGPR